MAHIKNFLRKLPIFFLCYILLFGFILHAQTKHTATLTWIPATGDVTFNVYRSTVSGSGYVKIGNTTNPTFIDTTGVGGTQYFYVVTGVDTGGDESANSSEVGATFLSNPGTPTGLKVVNN